MSCGIEALRGGGACDRVRGYGAPPGAVALRSSEPLSKARCLRFEATAGVPLSYLARIASIKEAASRFGYEVSELATAASQALQPLLSLLRERKAKALSELSGKDASESQSCADLTEEQYQQLDQYFRENPQVVKGFSEKDDTGKEIALTSFPRKKSNTEELRYSETELSCLYGKLSSNDSLYSFCVNEAQMTINLQVENELACEGAISDLRDMLHQTIKLIFNALYSK